MGCAREQMGRPVRRLPAVAAVVALGLVAVVFPGASMRADVDTDTWVAKVNGEPVSARLFQRRMVRNRALTYQYFRQEHGVGDSADFWTTSYGGEVPLERLKQQALDECVRIKVEQALAKKTGVIADISYSGFLASLAAENERRKRAVAAGEPIYGPMQYREDTYFTYVFSNMVIELKRRLGRGELSPTEDQLREHYGRTKDTLYKLDDRVEVWMIRVPFKLRPEESEGLTREDARARIGDAKARLDEGEEFELVAAAYNEDESLKERTFDDDSRRFDERRRPQLRKAAESLSAGEISDIVEERSAFHILMCVEREEVGHMPYDKVRHNVRGNYIDGQYEELVEELARAATVEINQPAYDGSRVR
jgi:hypothetical protein